MVLQGRPCGRVGRCQEIDSQKGEDNTGVCSSPFFFFSMVVKLMLLRTDETGQELLIG